MMQRILKEDIDIKENIIQQHHGQKISNGVVLESPMDMIVFRLEKVLTLIHGMITISAGKIM